MKIKWVKYLFIVFAIAILIFAIVKIRGQEKNNKNSQTGIQGTEEEKNTTLTLGVAQFDTINPILSNNKNIQDISKLIYEPLINVTKDYRLEKCLAVEWAKQDSTIYILKLRENAKWSDGNNFTAYDVKYTIDRLKEIDSIYSRNVQYVIGLEVVDDYTIKIELEKEIPFFQYYLTFPILSEKYYENEDFADTSKNSAPVGTGMYEIKESESNYITLVPNNNWWNKDNKKLTLDKIIVNEYATVGELYNSFKIGNVDIIGTSNINVQDYIGTIGYKQKEVKGREHCFIAFNTENYLLSDLNIRKAIAYSIDKSNITSSVYGGKYYTSSFPLDYGSWIYQDKDPSSGYNPDQAKQILVDDGWDYKYKYWQKYENYKTKRISLNLVVKSSDAERVDVANNIKSQLEDQGIRINIIKATDKQYENYINNKNYDMILCTTYLSPSPNMETYFGDENLANYSNEEISNLINEAKNTADENIIKDNFKRIAEIYKADIPYLSLFTSKYTIAYNTSIVGDVEGNWYNLFYNIETWYK